MAAILTLIGAFSSITTDGNTLLGADDKAGIAEIMNMLEYFSNSNEEHGDIYICFTPDEEIGLGTLHLNKELFKHYICKRYTRKNFSNEWIARRNKKSL